MTTTPTVVWQDDGKGWTATNPLTGSGASERWDAASGASGTSSAGQTIAPTYYHQFDVTVSITSIDGSIPGANDPTFSYTQFGSPVYSDSRDLANNMGGRLSDVEYHKSNFNF